LPPHPPRIAPGISVPLRGDAPGQDPAIIPLVSIAATTPESDFTPNGSQAVRVQIVNGAVVRAPGAGLC